MKQVAINLTNDRTLVSKQATLSTVPIDNCGLLESLLSFGALN